MGHCCCKRRQPWEQMVAAEDIPLPRAPHWREGGFNEQLSPSGQIRRRWPTPHEALPAFADPE